MIDQKNTFYRNIAQTTPNPIGIEVVRGEGVYLYGPNGEEYIDFVSGICVNNVGHSAPEVVSAIQKQAEKYLHPMVYGEYIMETQVAYAHRLVELLDSKLDTVYFTNSGTEAIEGALKLSKRFTGRQKILCCQNSYHGSTHGSLSITGNEKMKKGYGPFLPQVEFIPYNNFEALAKISDDTACFILEAIQGAGGVVVPDKAYLQAVRNRCDETGTIMILDEIQTGFGRTGHLFAHQGEGIVPDILVLAKALGGGLPLGAFIASQEHMSVLQKDPMLGHITTYGGNPLCCAAGLATLEKILAEDMISSIPSKEKILLSELKHPAIKELRGRGLLYALIMDDFETVDRIKDECLRRGLLTIFFLNIDNGLRISPPLNISEEEMYKSVKRLLDSIRCVCD